MASYRGSAVRLAETKGSYPPRFPREVAHVEGSDVLARSSRPKEPVGMEKLEFAKTYLRVFDMF